MILVKKAATEAAIATTKRDFFRKAKMDAVIVATIAEILSPVA